MSRRGAKPKYSDEDVSWKLLQIRSLHPEAMESIRMVPTIDRVPVTACPRCGMMVDLRTDNNGNLTAYDSRGLHPHREATRPDPGAVDTHGEAA